MEIFGDDVLRIYLALYLRPSAFPSSFSLVAVLASRKFTDEAAQIEVIDDPIIQERWHCATASGVTQQIRCHFVTHFAPYTKYPISYHHTRACSLKPPPKLQAHADGLG